MAHDRGLDDHEQPSHQYAALGDEVALVLASARDAASEMRNQARQYAQSLVDSAQEEVAALHRNARAEADKLVGAARREAEALLLHARKQVLATIESARARVDEAERSEAEARARRDQLLAAEDRFDAAVVAAMAATTRVLEELRDRRAEEADDVAEDPMSVLDAVLVASMEATDAATAAIGPADVETDADHEAGERADEHDLLASQVPAPADPVGAGHGSDLGRGEGAAQEPEAS